MRVAIIGTRGIPNRYGGFEQFAEHLAVGLAAKGFDVSVYNSHNHPFSGNEYKGVKIIHQFDPEYKYGSFGQFLYDRNCITDCRKMNFDIILQLGYTSSSIWRRLLPKQSIIVTNMDGLEWKRAKYSYPVKRFLRHAEKWAVHSSDILISDSVGIQTYLKNKYDKDPVYIPYGAIIPESYSENSLAEFSIEKKKYFLLIARMEPENNIENILSGHVNSGSALPFVVVGKTDNKYGKYLLRKYESNTNVKFYGGIYDQKKLNDLRHFSGLYFHGHSVGGTNPSLLEAMAAGCDICAHDNLFNSGILGDDAQYFSSSTDVTKMINELDEGNNEFDKVQNNLVKIKTIYSWDRIVSQYAEVFYNLMKKNKNV